jgi:hypothetical protein
MPGIFWATTFRVFTCQGVCNTDNLPWNVPAALGLNCAPMLTRFVKGVQGFNSPDVFARVQDTSWNRELWRSHSVMEAVPSAPSSRVHLTVACDQLDGHRMTPQFNQQKKPSAKLHGFMSCAQTLHATALQLSAEPWNWHVQPW